MKQSRRSYRRVTFRYLGDSEKVAYLYGEVLFREGTMILSIAGGDTPYSIEGKPCKTWFEGRNEQRIGWNQVKAKWTLLDDAYVGTWIEEGTKYLFSFELGAECEAGGG